MDLSFCPAFKRTLAECISLAEDSTLLCKIYPEALNGLTGTHLKIIVQPPRAGALVIKAARVGFPDGSPSSAVSHGDNPVPLTWDGGWVGGSFSARSVPPPDAIAFAVPDRTRPLLFAFDVAAGSVCAMQRRPDRNFAFFSKAGFEAALISRRGYTQNSGRLALIGQLLIGS